MGNVLVKYSLKGKILTPDEVEENKIFFDLRAFDSNEKTSAILKLRQQTNSDKISILYIDENFNLTCEMNIDPK